MQVKDRKADSRLRKVLLGSRRFEASLRGTGYYRGQSSAKKDPSPDHPGSSRVLLPEEETGYGRRTVLSFSAIRYFESCQVAWRYIWLLSFSARHYMESFQEAWGYIWLIWRKFAGLEEGYWHAWWYCIPLYSALFLLYPVSRILGMSLRKWILFSVESHVVALPIIRAIYHGLAPQASDGMRHVHDTCRRGIQLVRAKVQGIRLELSKEILLLLGEGYEFEKEKLIQLWMAEGFLETEPMELHGSHYFEKLISDGYILRSNSCLLHQVNSEKFNSDLGMTRDKFKSLAVLDLSRSNIKELPNSALKMIHLRYLDVSWTSIELLPERIGCLHKLQTLKLIGCSRLWRLPREMQGLTQLRHLDFDVLGHLASMPKGMGDLVNLRTLSAFIVGTRERGMIGEVGGLNNLMGEFCIARLEHVQDEHDAKMASLTAKRNLKKLELRWSDFPLRAIKNQNLDGTVLTHLCPHPDLEELVIRCYGGIRFPSWIGHGYFHRLSSISLFKCENVSVLPYVQMLPSLEYLGLTSMNSVTLMDFRGENEIDVAFPKLQRLVIHEMLNLNAWLEVLKGDFPSLTELTIKHCPILPELPSLVYLSTLKRLEIGNCRKVQLVDDKQLSVSVEFLIVENCPLIRKSFLKEEGRSYIWINEEANLDLMDDDDSKSDKVNEEPGGDGDKEEMEYARIDQEVILDLKNDSNELSDEHSTEGRDEDLDKLFPDDYDYTQVATTPYCSVIQPESKVSEGHNDSWYERLFFYEIPCAAFDTIRKPKSKINYGHDNDFSYHRFGEEIGNFFGFLSFF